MTCIDLILLAQWMVTYPDQDLPFQVGENGKITFDAKLSAELAKPENQDLVDWAHEHIVSLFE